MSPTFKCFQSERKPTELDLGIFNNSKHGSNELIIRTSFGYFLNLDDILQRNFIV